MTLLIRSSRPFILCALLGYFQQLLQGKEELGAALRGNLGAMEDAAAFTGGGMLDISLADTAN